MNTGENFLFWILQTKIMESRDAQTVNRLLDLGRVKLGIMFHASLLSAAAGKIEELSM